MNLRDLEYAVCLAAEGQFRRAATRCRVSQPTLSAQIAKLEDELGVQLFERGARVASPTVNGRAIIRQAQIVLDEVERLKAMARAGQDPLQGPFRLGVIPTAGPYLLPRLLPVLREHWPQLRLLLREEQTTALTERLRAGSLDAAILSLPLDGDDLRWERLLAEPILVALPRGHRLAAERRIAPRALSREPIVLLEEGHCLREQSLSICAAAGLSNRRDDDVQAAGLETMRQMVMAGIGVALVPEMAALAPFGTDELAVYRRFAPPEPERELVLAWRRSFPRGDALQDLARGLRGELTARAP
ncbi:MAG: LysR family transcriptional regulator [Alphaproteobacteria bacterium]|nr:LysR family transcriptional regulator [Alphaproteobacteria bacterium]